MIHRLKFSSEASNIFKELQAQTHLTPNILARLAVGISLTVDGEPEIAEKIKLNDGLEINRQTLTGDYDLIYKALITQHSRRELADEEYFPTLFNAHVERGLTMLQNEYKYSGNTDKFYENLLKFNLEG